MTPTEHPGPTATSMRPCDYVWKRPGLFERVFGAAFNALFDTVVFLTKA